MLIGGKTRFSNKDTCQARRVRRTSHVRLRARALLVTTHGGGVGRAVDEREDTRLVARVEAGAALEGRDTVVAPLTGQKEELAAAVEVVEPAAVGRLGTQRHA